MQGPSYARSLREIFFSIDHDVFLLTQDCNRLYPLSWLLVKKHFGMKESGNSWKVFSLVLFTLILYLIMETNTFLFQFSIHNYCFLNEVQFLTVHVSSTEFVLYVHLSNSHNLLLQE